MLPIGITIQRLYNHIETVAISQSDDGKMRVRIRFRARSDRSGNRCRHDLVRVARSVLPVTPARGCSVSILAGRACCGLSVRGLLSCLALLTVLTSPTIINLSVYASVTVDGLGSGFNYGFEPDSFRLHRLKSLFVGTRLMSTEHTLRGARSYCSSEKTPEQGRELTRSAPPRSLLKSLFVSSFRTSVVSAR